MADDTRQNREQLKEDLSREALTINPDQKAFEGKQWQDAKVQRLKGPENANALAGATMNTAGGKIPEVTLSSVFSSIKLEEFKEIHKKPCVRDSLMLGIGAGFGIGGVRALLGGKVWTCCNWAVVSFVAGSAGQYQFCQYRRHAEREGMTRIVEAVNRKDLERKAREARKEQVRKERRKVQEAEQDSRFAAARAAAEKNESAKGWKWW